MSKFIIPEYWITCAYCGQEVCMVGNVPGKDRAAQNKSEAWEAAKDCGWVGGYSKPKCEECAREEVLRELSEEISWQGDCK